MTTPQERTNQRNQDAITYAQQHPEILDTQGTTNADNGCMCSWRPRSGVIGGETLEEHQRFCSIANNIRSQQPPPELHRERMNP